MWNYVGIVRTGERLGRAVADIRDLEKRLSRFYHETKISREIVDLIHGCLLKTTDAADERSSVDLGGRRIIKKKNEKKKQNAHVPCQT